MSCPVKEESRLNIGILSVQGDFRVNALTLSRLRVSIANHNVPIVCIDVRNAQSLSRCDALIIPGGESTTIGLLLNDYNLIQPLQDFVKSGKPIWGICAGLILLSNKIDNRLHFQIPVSDRSRVNAKREYDQPLIGGLDVITHRNYFGRQCRSCVAPIYLNPSHATATLTHSYFIRAPAILNTVSNKVKALGYVYVSNSGGNRDTIVSSDYKGGSGVKKVCVAVEEANILATAFHPEIFPSVDNNAVDSDTDIYLSTIGGDPLQTTLYWHNRFLTNIIKHKYPNLRHSVVINLYRPLSAIKGGMRRVSNGDVAEYGSFSVKKAFQCMLEGGVIMDVVNAEQARIAEEAGACCVMALERIPADIKKDGGVSRMSDPHLITSIMGSVSIPVMAKSRIGHFGEARILESLGVDCIDESEVLTAADEKYHINKRSFMIPFVCGACNLGEALRRIAEGAAMIRLKGNAGTGNVTEAVRHARLTFSEIRRLQTMDSDELYDYAKTIAAPVSLVELTAKLGRLPVVTFAAGGISTPADVLLMMALGCDGVFVGSGIFKSDNPSKRARAIVHSCTHWKEPSIVAKVSANLGKAMVGILRDGESYRFIHKDSKL